MDNAKMTTVAEYMHTHEDVARFFPRLMIRRMSFYLHLRTWMTALCFLWMK